MRFFDWLVVIVMGVVGWLVVSFLLNRSKAQRDDSDSTSGDATFENPPARQPSAQSAPVARLPAPPSAVSPELRAVPDRADDPSALLSLEEIGRAWSSILGVPNDASGAVIEQAYHAKLADCDRVRFDANASPSSRRQAEQQRAWINQAYEFIRPSRS